MRVLVVGAGYVGARLAERLAHGGHDVWAVRRDPSALPSFLAAVAADVTDPATLGALPTDVDRVVYCVGASARTPGAYRAAYVDGLRNVLSELQGSAARRLVFVSSTAVFSESDGGWVDEASETDASSFSAAALLEGEELARTSGLDATVLRLAGIYGPGRTFLIRQVASREARVEPADHEGPPRYGNRIHRDDCAGAIEHLLGLPAVAPCYVGVDDDPAPLAETYRFVADHLGVAAPAEGAVGEGRGGNKRCLNARLRASGYSLAYPSYRDGYPAIIDAYREALR